MTKFEVGSVYFARSIGDYDCVWTFEVVARTAKFITLRDVRGTHTFRVGVNTWDGDETAMPFGRYSMAPMLRAGRTFGRLSVYLSGAT